MWKKFLYWCFPYGEMILANRKITKKVKEFKKEIDRDETYMSDYMKGFVDIPLEEAEKIYNSILSNRRSLEEKAKVNVLIVTIAVTVILGLSSFLFTVQEKIPDGVVYTIILTSLFILSLIYLTVGSIISLATLNTGESKEIYHMSPLDYQYFASLSDIDERAKEIRYFYSRYAELNMAVNWKINNYVSCTYANIRNALILLGIIGIVFCSIFIMDKNDEKIKLEKELHNNVRLLESIEDDLTSLQSETDKNNQQHNKQDAKQEEILNQIRALKEELKKPDKQ